METGRRCATARTRDNSGEVGGGDREGGVGGVRDPSGISSLSTGLYVLLVSFSSSDITPEKQETTKIRCLIDMIDIIGIIDIIY